MSSLFSILVNIEASTAQLESSLQRAERQITQFAEGAKRAAESFAGFAGIAISFDALGESIRSAVERGDDLLTLSGRLGASVSDLSQLQYVAKSVGVSFEGLTGSFDTFSRNIGMAAEGTGRARVAISDLGLSAQKLVQLPFTQQLDAVANALAGIENPTKRAQLEMQIFGEEGAELDPILRRGAAGITQLMQAADRAGVTLDASMAQSLHETQEALQQANAQVEAATTKLAIGLAPAIETLAGWLGKATTAAQGFGEAIAKAMTGGADPIENLQNQLQQLAQKRADIEAAIQKAQSSSHWLTSQSTVDAYIGRAKQQLSSVEAEMNRVNGELLQWQKDTDLATQSKSRPAPNASDSGPSANDLVEQHVLVYRAMTDTVKEYYDDLDRMTQTSVEKTITEWAKQEAAINALVQEGIINHQEGANRSAELLDKTLQPVQVTAKYMAGDSKPQFDALTSMADQAARNIQGAFANFLFDPFKGGVKGMLVSFADTIRHMLAEAAAADIMGAIFHHGDDSGGKGDKGTGLGGVLTSVLELGSKGGGGGSSGSLIGLASKGIAGTLEDAFGGSGDMVSASIGATSYASTSLLDAFAGGISGALAGGGDVNPGESYLVGEVGPELFTPSAHGTVFPNSALGGTVHYHAGDSYIDARGADADRIMTMLPPILAQHAARIKADVLNGFRRNGLAAPARV